MKRAVIIIRGAGDLATGIGHKLHRCGFRVLMLEREQPLVIRRAVAFASAIYEDSVTIEGITAQKVVNHNNIMETWKRNQIPVLIDPEAEVLKTISPAVLIDAIMAKRNNGTARHMAPLTIGVGPGFNAGTDVNVVIETQRGHDLGRIIKTGSAAPNTGMPACINGYSTERVVRAPNTGIIRGQTEIGDMVTAGQVIAYVGFEPVITQISGVIRGLIKDGIRVKEGMKIADIDPRGVREYCFSISDKARAIGGAVLEAVVCYMLNGEGESRRG